MNSNENIDSSWKIDPKTKTLVPVVPTPDSPSLAERDCLKTVVIKHVGNLTHAELLQILILECGWIDENDVQYGVDYFSGKC